MFRKASLFNQPIGGWDVSKETDFVSNDQAYDSNVHSLCSVSNLDTESIHHRCMAFLDGGVLNESLFSLFSLV
jgi:hypothetical protein